MAHRKGGIRESSRRYVVTIPNGRASQLALPAWAIGTLQSGRIWASLVQWPLKCPRASLTRLFQPKPSAAETFCGCKSKIAGALPWAFGNVACYHGWHADVGEPD
jgi:hypothetical protein